MTHHAELLQRIVMFSVGLDSAILEGFADQLEKLPAEPGTDLLNGLTSGVAQPEARAELIALVKHWRKEAPDVTARELAWAIRAANSTDNFHRERQKLKIVWTGPASKESAFRRTDQALLALIQQAKTSIILVTFAAYKVPHISAALVAAAVRGVKVTLILESMEESDGKVMVSAITGAAEEYRRNQLPNETRKQRHRIVSQLIQRRIKSHEVGRAENLQRPAIRCRLRPGENAPHGKRPCVVAHLPSPTLHLVHRINAVGG